MIREKISSNIDVMQELHVKYGWIPGRENIRPHTETIEKKTNYIENMLKRYETIQDMFLHSVFGLKTETKGDWLQSKMFVSQQEIDVARQKALTNGKKHEFRFIPNRFPYQLPVGTNHYVIWFLLDGNEKIDAASHSNLSDNEINACIEQAIGQLLGANNTRFSFVWYPNPKPTIVSDVLHHVQVFWTSQVEHI
jgi:hypothetical protein